MICAVVLAAGRSSRMGRNKMLLPFRGGTIIGGVVDAVLGSMADRTVVVVGHEGELVARELAGRAVDILRNTAAGSEMLESVRVALRSLPRECTGVMVLPGDHPRMSSAILDRLLRAFALHPLSIVVPVASGRRGHPIVFPASLSREILERHDGAGLRGLLDEHAAEVLEVEMQGDEVLSDMDDEEDYRRVLRG